MRISWGELSKYPERHTEEIQAVIDEWRDMANQQFMLGHYKQALQNYFLIIRQGKTLIGVADFAKLHGNIAQVYYEQEKYAACIKYANLVIDEQDSDNALKAKCYYRRAWAYQAQENRRAAYDDCVSASALPLKHTMRDGCRQLKQKLDREKAKAAIVKHGAKQQSITDECPAPTTVGGVGKSDSARVALTPPKKICVGGFNAKEFKGRVAFWQAEFASEAREQQPVEPSPSSALTLGVNQ